MASKNKDVSEDFDVLKADVAKLRSDLSSTTRKLVEIGKDETGAAKERAQSEAAKLLTELEGAVEQSKQKGRRAKVSVENKVTQRPFVSLIIVFILGLFFGKIFDSRD